MNPYSELHKCPVCGTENGFIPRIVIYGPAIETKDGYRGAYESKYYECVICGCCFQNPQPDMTGYYTSGAYRASLAMDVADMDKNEEARAQRICAFIAGQSLVFDSFLDVGASRGFLMNRVEETFGARVVGVEPNSQWPKTKWTTVRSLADAQGKFGLVACIHTLEHVPSPVSFLIGMASKLAPGGHLIVEVPYIGSEATPYRFAHLTVFDVPSLRSAFKVAGLSVTGVQVGPDLLFVGTPA